MECPLQELDLVSGQREEKFSRRTSKGNWAKKLPNKVYMIFLDEQIQQLCMQSLYHAPRWCDKMLSAYHAKKLKKQITVGLYSWKKSNQMMCITLKFSSETMMMKRWRRKSKGMQKEGQYRSFPHISPTNTRKKWSSGWSFGEGESWIKCTHQCATLC